jgi:uncharacterized protein (TIGR03000 family)
MYSVVLMAALATTADAPACHGGGCGCHGGCYGCYGCYGGCYGCYGGCYGCYGGCYGCYGGCWGGCYGCYGGGVIVAPPAGGGEVIPAKPKEMKGKEGETAAPRTAKLVVELPDDAKLFIDDQLMKTPSGKRTFNTPTLDRGQAYYYMVRAEVVRDGKTYSETKRVIIRVGDTAQALFPETQLVRAENEVKAVASR